VGPVHESVVALSRSLVCLYVRILEALSQPVSRAHAQAYRPIEVWASSSEAVAVPACSACNCRKAAMHPYANIPTAILHAQLGCVYGWRT
jgi:hypothetical protein